MKSFHEKFALKIFIKREAMDIIKSLVTTLTVAVTAVYGLANAADPSDKLPTNLKSYYDAHKMELSFQETVVSCQQKGSSYQECVDQVQNNVYKVKNDGLLLTEKQYTILLKHPELTFQDSYLSCLRYVHKEKVKRDCEAWTKELTDPVIKVEKSLSSVWE